LALAGSKKRKNSEINKWQVQSCSYLFVFKLIYLVLLPESQFSEHQSIWVKHKTKSLNKFRLFPVFVIDGCPCAP
jgi:hypothetical protein